MFYFYLYWFHIQCNFCYKGYLLLLIYNNIFLLIKKISNTPNYSVFDCFIFFFQPEKTSYAFSFFTLKSLLMLLTVLSSFAFFSLKIFFTYLIMLSMSARYYQKKKEKIQKRFCERYQNLTEEDIKIFQKMKNKG